MAAIHRLPVLSVVLVCLAALAVRPATATAGESEDRVVLSAAIVLQQLQGMAVPQIPAGLLQNAEGVAIFPNVIRAGFIVAGRHGHGVLLVRAQDGTWSNPIFLTLTGGGVGWQAGVQSTDVVLVLKTPRSVAALLNGQRFTLGGDASVAAGPVGREAAAMTDLQLQAEIYSYSRSRGLFAGVALNGTMLSVDAVANASYYQSPLITVNQILANSGQPSPSSAVNLRNLLAKSAAQARIEYVGGVPQTFNTPGQPAAQPPAAGSVPMPVNELQPPK